MSSNEIPACRLDYVQQPTSNSCVAASVAMIAGIPIDTVMEEFHEPWFADVKSTNPIKYLKSKGFEVVLSGSPYDNWIPENAIVMLTVASLNIEGGLHCVAMDCHGRNDDGDVMLYLLDPNMGKDGRRYYVMHEADDDMAVHLDSWIVDFYVPVEVQLSEAA